MLAKVRYYQCLSVCLSVGLCRYRVRKNGHYRRNFWTTWQGHHPRFHSPTAVTKFQAESLQRGRVKYEGVGKFLQVSPFISEMVQNRAMVITEH